MLYFTLTTPTQATLDIKKSQFLGFAYPITSREQLMFHVEQLRQQYPNAHHVCYAYIIGDPNNATSAGFDDDGEPSGTAGKPILNVIQHKGIGNCLIAVVRYFGGIKLGAGGLTRAYSGTAQAVIKNMDLTRFIAMTTVTVITDFANESHIRHLNKVHHATIETVDYQAKKTVLTINLAQNKVAEFETAVSQIAIIQK